MNGTDQSADDHRWAEWVRSASAAVGVDAESVDIAAIHHLSKQVAHRLERPLVPVSAFILGLALGAGREGGPLSHDEAMSRLLGTLPVPGDASTGSRAP